jgi:hypothetical protein
MNTSLNNKFDKDYEQAIKLKQNEYNLYFKIGLVLMTLSVLSSFSLVNVFNNGPLTIIYSILALTGITLVLNGFLIRLQLLNNIRSGRIHDEIARIRIEKARDQSTADKNT